MQVIAEFLGLLVPDSMNFLHDWITPHVLSTTFGWPPGWPPSPIRGFSTPLDNSELSSQCKRMVSSQVAYVKTRPQIMPADPKSTSSRQLDPWPSWTPTRFASANRGAAEDSRRSREQSVPESQLNQYLTNLSCRSGAQAQETKMSTVTIGLASLGDTQRRLSSAFRAYG